MKKKSFITSGPACESAHFSSSAGAFAVRKAKYVRRHDKTNKVASAKSDQSLCYAFKGYRRVLATSMSTAKTLIRLSECPG